MSEITEAQERLFMLVIGKCGIKNKSLSQVATEIHERADLNIHTVIGVLELFTKKNSKEICQDLRKAYAQDVEAEKDTPAMYGMMQNLHQTEAPSFI